MCFLVNILPHYMIPGPINIEEKTYQMKTSFFSVSTRFQFHQVLIEISLRMINLFIIRTFIMTFNV